MYSRGPTSPRVNGEVCCFLFLFVFFHFCLKKKRKPWYISHLSSVLRQTAAGLKTHSGLQRRRRSFYFRSLLRAVKEILDFLVHILPWKDGALERTMLASSTRVPACSFSTQRDTLSLSPTFAGSPNITVSTNDSIDKHSVTYRNK